MLRMLALSLLCASPMFASAQEFFVFTKVRAAVDGAPTGPSLSRSTTFFHAGRSYDHMEDVGELVICDPIKRRITLLHRGQFGTRLEFEELAQYVNVGRNETEKYAAEIAESPKGLTVATALKFQLDPMFEHTLSGSQLRLAGSHWQYDVALDDKKRPGFATRYADYADLAARLNFVLHPQAYFPAVRERLNEELRQSEQVPVRVHLTANVGNKLELVADHSYRWTLNNRDRLQLRKFDELATSDSVEWVNFRDYQTRVVSGGY